MHTPELDVGAPRPDARQDLLDEHVEPALGPRAVEEEAGSRGSLVGLGEEREVDAVARDVVEALVAAVDLQVLPLVELREHQAPVDVPEHARELLAPGRHREVVLPEEVAGASACAARRRWAAAAR